MRETLEGGSSLIATIAIKHLPIQHLSNQSIYKDSHRNKKIYYITKTKLH